MKFYEYSVSFSLNASHRLWNCSLNWNNKLSVFLVGFRLGEPKPFTIYHNFFFLFFPVTF